MYDALHFLRQVFSGWCSVMSNAGKFWDINICSLLRKKLKEYDTV